MTHHEITPFPDPRREVDRHREMILYSWSMQMAVERAECERRQGNPFNALTIPDECRAWSKLEFEIYIQKNNIIGA